MADLPYLAAADIAAMIEAGARATSSLPRRRTAAPTPCCCGRRRCCKFAFTTAGRAPRSMPTMRATGVLSPLSFAVRALRATSIRRTIWQLLFPIILRTGSSAMSPDREFLSRDLGSLMREAAAIRDAAFGDRVTFSKKVFIPLTHLCRDICDYCTFVHPPRRGECAVYARPSRCSRSRAPGKAAGCEEALFTLGDKPELRWKPAAEALAEMGTPRRSTICAAMGELVFKETGLLPHFNPGLMDAPTSEAAAGLGLDGHHARERRPSGSASAAAALRRARQGSGAAARDPRGGGRSEGAVHLRHPDRHRRDARGTRRGAAGAARRCTRRTATCRKSSSRTSRPSPTRAWPTRRSPRSTSCCGPSPWRA